MNRAFFLMLVLMVWLIPSLAGCAKGGESHPRRPSMNDAGRISYDAGSPVLSRDAGTVGFDAARTAGTVDASVSRDAAVAVSSHDAGRPLDAYTPPDPGGSHLLRIALSSTARAQCPAGWRIRLWLTDPPVESTRGLDLELHIPVLTAFGPWSSITLWCDERSPQWFSWNVSDRTAMGSGIFSELSLDGVDLRSSTMLCEDPLAPDSGFRPILMWEAGRRGSCPP